LARKEWLMEDIKLSLRLCETKGCKKKAEPFLTKPIAKLGPGEHQPLWFCPEHAPYLKSLRWMQNHGRVT
jgi:hypothetical protein